MILFQFKVFARNIKEATLARYFIKITMRPSFTQLRVIRQIEFIKYENRKYVTKIQLYLLCLNSLVLVSKPKINLNFYIYNAITRIDSSSNIIKFYTYCFSNYVTLKKAFDQKNRVALHKKIDLHLLFLKRTSRAECF